MTVQDDFGKEIFPIILNSGQDNEIIVESKDSIMQQELNGRLFNQNVAFDSTAHCCCEGEVKMCYNPSMGVWQYI